MSDQEDKELIVRRAVFGKQVAIFIDSDIGQYLLARAADESEQALVNFKACSPSDVAGVTELQNIMKQADNFKTWLDEAVTDGLQALNILEDRE